MTLENLATFAARYAQESLDNRVAEEAALAPGLAGLRMYDAPLMGVADAADALFVRFREPGIVGAKHCLPGDFLPGARRVVSFFFPITREIRDSNTRDRHWPSREWLHARYEGQLFLNAFLRACIESLQAADVSAGAPMLDARFSIENDISNWSERHVAFACGLGTFGLARGLLTEKGAAGRVCSLVVNADWPVTRRRYTRYDEYCTYCGACVAKCPPHAIDREHGKDNAACADFLKTVRQREQPRYGCGKCQVGVPCAHGIPNQ